MQILSNSPDPRLGGPWQRSLDVARGLRDRDVETEFLVAEGDDSFADVAGDAGFRCNRIEQPRLRSPRKVRANMEFVTGFRRCVREVQRLIGSRDVDVVHANGPLNYAVALAAARSDASLVWHFNDTLTPSPFKELSATLAKRWADERVVAARAVHDYFFDDGTDTTTVYPPVDLDEFDPDRYASADEEVRAELGIDEETDIVGTIGNINPAKGHEYLIDAFGSVSRSRDVHLVVVGKRLDSQQAYYRKLQKRVHSLGIEAKVTFAGWHSDVARLLAVFDLFVLSSVTEACPIVVLEAMAMRCPVVSTDVGGVTEQIPTEEYGLVVPPTNVEALTAAIDDGLSSPDRRRERAEMARSRVEREFSLDRCVESHLAVYRRAVPGSR